MAKTDSTKTTTAANLAAWDEVAPIHGERNQARLLEAVAQPGFSCLDPTETGLLEMLGVEGKDVAQLCCNNGRELLSIKNLGAGRCVGFDGSRAFLDQAEALAAAGGIDVAFHCTDVYDMDQSFADAFDLVTVTVGVIGWMPDLTGFFAAATRLLRPGGALFVYEQHPILDMIAPGGAEAPIDWDASYFRREPFIETEGLDYYGGQPYAAKPSYWFPRTMAEIITAGLENGLRLELFEEYPHHISNTWWNVEEAAIGLPMSYALIYRNADQGRQR